MYLSQMAFYICRIELKFIKIDQIHRRDVYTHTRSEMENTDDINI